MDLLSYPLQYIVPVQLADGRLLQLRPIHPLDGGRATAFKSSLSAESIRARFHGYIPTISEAIVKRLTEIDYRTEMAIIAEVPHEEEKEIVAVARIVQGEPKQAEYAIIISDRWHGHRLGSILTDFMLRIAREMGFQTVHAYVQEHNVAMLEILRRRGFSLELEDEFTVIARLELE